MGIHVIRVPDIGEGIAETEIVEWLVGPGDLVAEDQPIVAVMTDKATVEIPSAVSGNVLSFAAAVGETIAVGAELIRLEVAGEGNLSAAASAAAAKTEPQPVDKQAIEVVDAPKVATPKPPAPKAPAKTGINAKAAVAQRPQAAATDRPLAAPSVRALARERGINLRNVPASGPEGRVLREDVESFDPDAVFVCGVRPDVSVEETKVTGLRKRIAERMELANRVPQITIVEEIDVTALEALRSRLNERSKGQPDAVKLTLLPFVTRAIVKAVAEQPVMNAHFDADAGILRKFGGVHVGIAAQTPVGLVVPVVRHAEALNLGSSAREIARLSEAAKSGKATRDELSGSTITITSLGTLGGLATTPILNVPEAVIVGINKMAIRPSWTGNGFEPRKMMNVSCSFDHRVIDGWDAAVFVQRLKELLETPAMLFIEA